MASAAADPAEPGLPLEQSSSDDDEEEEDETSVEWVDIVEANDHSSDDFEEVDTSGLSKKLLRLKEDCDKLAMQTTSDIMLLDGELAILKTTLTQYQALSERIIVDAESKVLRREMKQIGKDTKKSRKQLRRDQKRTQKSAIKASKAERKRLEQEYEQSLLDHLPSDSKRASEIAAAMAAEVAAAAAAEEEDDAGGADADADADVKDDDENSDDDSSDDSSSDDDSSAADVEDEKVDGAASAAGDDGADGGKTGVVLPDGGVPAVGEMDSYVSVPAAAVDGVMDLLIHGQNLIFCDSLARKLRKEKKRDEVCKRVVSLIDTFVQKNQSMLSPSSRVILYLSGKQGTVDVRSDFVEVIFSGDAGGESNRVRDRIAVDARKSGGNSKLIITGDKKLTLEMAAERMLIINVRDFYAAYVNPYLPEAEQSIIKERKGRKKFRKQQRKRMKRRTGKKKTRSHRKKKRSMKKSSTSKKKKQKTLKKQRRKKKKKGAEADAAADADADADADAGAEPGTTKVEGPDEGSDSSSSSSSSESSGTRKKKKKKQAKKAKKASKKKKKEAKKQKKKAKKTKRKKKKGTDSSSDGSD